MKRGENIARSTISEKATSVIPIKKLKKQRQQWRQRPLNNIALIIAHKRCRLDLLTVVFTTRREKIVFFEFYGQRQCHGTTFAFVKIF